MKLSNFDINGNSLDKGTLIDEVTSTIILDSGPTIEFVNPGKFLPLCD